jgi:hypothetical protein
MAGGGGSNTSSKRSGDSARPDPGTNAFICDRPCRKMISRTCLSRSAWAVAAGGVRTCTPIRGATGATGFGLRERGGRCEKKNGADDGLKDVPRHAFQYPQTDAGGKFAGVHASRSPFKPSASSGSGEVMQ